MKAKLIKAGSVIEKPRPVAPSAATTAVVRSWVSNHQAAPRPNARAAFAGLFKGQEVSV